MKLNKRSVLTAGAILLIPVAAYAVVTYADNLDVGSQQNAQLNNDAASVGRGNQASYDSLSVGRYNKAHGNGMSMGHTNIAHTQSMAIGEQNSVNYQAAGYPRNSLAVGNGNTIYGEESFAAGLINDITADQSTTLGSYLVSTADNATIVGTYNADKAGVLFVVGNGDSTTRQNALEVHDNGDVIVSKPQGDISMGIFGQ
ncbi:hypothetical protein Rhal01_03393 [Rubritalea halochordaticola]|uniref:Curlin n=1 Tax=Rubritalea halochordaticola TaxID=714537 RepID=A0ABP9V586_9BACT